MSFHSLFSWPDNNSSLALSDLIFIIFFFCFLSSFVHTRSSQVSTYLPTYLPCPTLPTQYTNNTRMSLRPAPPSFPLSSPITEEIPSPVSSSSEKGGWSQQKPNQNQSQDQKRDQNKALEVLSKTPRQKAALHTARPTAHRSHVASTDHSYIQPQQPATQSQTEDKQGKPKRPLGLNLNLVTDFPSGPSTSNTKKKSPTLVDLHDLKTLCRTRERERSVQKIKGILKKRRSRGRVEQKDEWLEGGRRASLLDANSLQTEKGNELSLGERRIDIGLTVPHSTSQERLSLNPKSRSKRKELPDTDQFTPLTPSIVVTPAREDSFWEGDLPVAVPPVYEHPKPRVASSVYSQPTPCLDAAEVPPVPAIPAGHSMERIAKGLRVETPNLGVATPNSRIDTPNLRIETDVHAGVNAPNVNVVSPTTTRSSFQQQSKKTHTNSTDTIIDESPDSGTSTSPHKKPDRLSINTDTNRPQSQGWWTYLLSPLFKRSSTATAKTPITPDWPSSLPRAVLGVSSQDWWEKEVSCFSPDTPESGRLGEGNWQSTNPFVDGVPRNDTGAGAGAGANAGTDIFAGQAIQGCAAEYYQACAHELFSGTPYFECVNHVCSITPKDKIPQPIHELSAQPHQTPRKANKGLALVGVDDHPSHYQYQSPSSRTQRYSGSTAINDRGIGSTTLKGDSPDLTVKLKQTNHIPGNLGTIPRKMVPEEPRPATPITPFYIPPVKAESESNPNLAAQARPGTPVTPFYIPQPQAQPQHTQTNTTNTVTVERAVPHYIVIPQHGQPQSPLPVSPAFEQASDRTGIPLSNIHGAPAAAVYTTADEHVRTSLPQRPGPATTRGTTSTTRSTTFCNGPDNDRIESRRRRHEKEEKASRKAGSCWRGRGPFSSKGCFGRSGREGRKRRRWYLVIAALFLIILLTAILLAIFLARRGGGHSPSDSGSGDGGNGSDDNDQKPTPVNTQWLNLTGYPPMPTGLATIAGPKPRTQESGCIHPTTLWSCALPKEQHDDNKPYDADEPDFFVQIQFRNGSYVHSTVASRSVEGRGNGSGNGNESWEAEPAPPGEKEQAFLGNTTDGNAAPYAGEETPFYMTFLSPYNTTTSSSSDLTKRSTSSFPNLTDIIPPLTTSPNGIASPTTLYPHPRSQPIRLYNRGRVDEHYGFYTYFDKSIFLETTAPLNGSFVDGHLGDREGGSWRDEARVRCTWAQTRFLVKIWTKPDKTLLQSGSGDGKKGDYTRPGTFPYPVTITLDRHGGAAKKKMVYCYGINDDGTVDSSALKLQVEERGYNGALINPAPGIFNNTSDSGSGSGSGSNDEGGDGVDGGDGGCACEWANWVSLT